MATYNEKTGYIELTDEDQDALQNGLGSDWAENIINWIINGE